MGLFRDRKSEKTVVGDEITQNVKQFIETTVINVEAGDVLHVRVGILDLGDGQGPWIPNDEEIRQIREEFDKYFAHREVDTLVTHFGVEVEKVFHTEPNVERLKHRTIEIARAKAQTYDRLVEHGLPIPPDLKAEVEASRG